MSELPAPPTDHWVHDLSPFLIQFTETFGVRYYGLAYALGFLGGYWLLLQYGKKGRSPFHGEDVWNLVLCAMIGLMIGGRVGYFLFYDFGSLVENPLNLFYVWEGGMASHGGFLGGLTGLWFFARKREQCFWLANDLVLTVTPLGLLLGRVANFINGELWGRATSVSWGVYFPKAYESFPPFGDGLVWVLRHPSQLYAAVLEGLIPLIYMQLRFWLSDPQKRPAGRLVAEFLVLYAIMRIAGEQFREPDAGLIAGISRGQFYSIFFILIGLALWLWTARPKPNSSGNGSAG